MRRRVADDGRPLLLLALLVAHLCTSSPATAVQQAPDKVPVQGTLRSVGGGPVSDGNYVFILKLYDGATAAVPLWKEVQATVAVQGGLFTLWLGKEEPGVSAQLAMGAPRWLGIQVGSDPELPRVELGTAPSAHFAYAAGKAADVQCSACISADELADGAVTATKVAFNYAASADKGGAALTALEANQANVAKVALSAQFADDAGSLSCTGCVGMAQLDAAAKQAFVAATGGTVGGALTVKGALAAETTLAVSGAATLGGAAVFASDATVKGATVLQGATTLQGAAVAQGGLTVAQGLQLGDSVISGGRLATIDTKQSACGANDLGRIGIAAANKRLYFCDGSAWKRLSLCSEVCAQPETVTCGQPLTDACGEGACAGTGTLCPVGQACSNGACTCTAGTALNPAANCAAVLACKPGSPSGLYWLDLDGNGAKPAVQAYCDMTTDAGPWMLLYSYRHPAGQTGKPVDPTKMPTDPSNGYSHRLLADFGVAQNWAKEVRLYCQTSAHTRKIHFRTSKATILNSLWDGKSYANAADWQSGFTPMAGHNGNLPAATDSVWSSSLTAGLTEFPFYKGGTWHWGLRGDGERWECDDYPSGPGPETLHQVWVK